MSKKEIEDWDEGYWICPDCNHNNTLPSWVSIESCDNCHVEHEFESDYVGEGIAVSYVGRVKNKESSK